MTMASNKQQNNNSSSSSPPSGLGHSTPLVRVQNVHGAGIRRGSTSSSNSMSTSSAADHHPLASPPPNSSVELSERTASVAQTPPENTSGGATKLAVSNTAGNYDSAATVSPPPPPPPAPTVVPLPPPTTVSPPPPPKQQASTKQQSPVARSLDVLADAFLSHGPSKRQQSNNNLPPLLRPLPLPTNEFGIARLRTLVVRRAWGDVLQVANDILRGDSSSPCCSIYRSLTTQNENNATTMISTNQDARQDTFEAMTLECHAWLQLRRYTELGAEIQKWNFLQQNTGTNGDGDESDVPLSLHILAAESLEYYDTSNRCSDVLLGLREQQQNKNALSLACINSSLSNVYIRSKEWRMALQSLDELLNVLEDAVEEYVEGGGMSNVNVSEDRENACKILVGAFQCEILSRQAKVLLQVGAIAEATELMKEAQAAWTEASALLSSCPIRDQLQRHEAIQHAPAQLHVNEGLLCFAHANYEQAMASFKRGIDQQRSLLEPTNTTTIPMAYEYRQERWMGPNIVSVDATNSALTTCCNNLALCALYTCRKNEAVQLMESLVREDPTAFLTERMAFNLCTLYELGSDTTTNARRKRVLQLIAKRFFLHDIGPESFRIS